MPGWVIAGDSGGLCCRVPVVHAASIVRALFINFLCLFDVITEAVWTSFCFRLNDYFQSNTDRFRLEADASVFDSLWLFGEQLIYLPIVLEMYRYSAPNRFRFGIIYI